MFCSGRGLSQCFFSIAGPKGRQKLFGNKNFEAFPLLVVELWCETSAPPCTDSWQLMGRANRALWGSVTGTRDRKGDDETMQLGTRLNKWRSCSQEQLQLQVQLHIQTHSWVSLELCLDELCTFSEEERRKYSSSGTDTGSWETKAVEGQV